MKNTCKTITLSALCLLVLCLLTSCKGESKYQTFRLYSEIKDEAYTDKSDIHYKERTRGNYMRTCAGFLKALNDRDVNSMKKFCADELLAMDSGQRRIRSITMTMTLSSLPRTRPTGSHCPCMLSPEMNL